MVVEQRWFIHAFEHPHQGVAMFCRQKLTKEQLLKAVEMAIRKGANLIYVRGVIVSVREPSVFGVNCPESEVAIQYQTKTPETEIQIHPKGDDKE